jgi:uncharacterized protein
MIIGRNLYGGAHTVFPQPDFDGAKKYALQRLESDLSPTLSYHSVYHTRDDVLPAAERLALLEGIGQTDLLLLKTAVLFHDIGFTHQVDSHELISAEMASEVLPMFHYQPSQIRKISQMILVTRLFTPPHSLLEAIMVDADLDVLGRSDFFERNQALRTELSRLGKSISDEQWYAQQLNFMRIHSYRTISAQSLRNARKRYNTFMLKNLLKTSYPVLYEERFNGCYKKHW